MKALIVPNLMDVIEDFMGTIEGHRTNPDFIALCNRIAGKEVELKFINGDAFEAIDNNYWLPDCCWSIQYEPPEVKQ